MIGLGVGHRLRAVHRHPPLPRITDGLTCDESIARAAATSGGAVFFAGCTVTIALVSLAVAGIPLVTTMGLMAAIAVVVAVLRGADAAAGGARDPRAATSTRCGCATRTTEERRQERPVGQVGPRDRQAPADRRPGRAGDPDPADDPAAVADPRPAGHGRAVDLDHRAPGLRPDLEELRPRRQRAAAHRGHAGLASTAGHLDERSAPGRRCRRTSPRRRASRRSRRSRSTRPARRAFFNAISKHGPAENATDRPRRTTLRYDVIPKAEKGTDMKADVGGSTAGYDDLASKISSKLPLQILVVIALSFVLLMLAFRTVVIPPQAAVMNLLSIGASYGVLTAIFQYGWLERRDRAAAARCRSSPTCRCSCSRSCSASRWTTRCSSSARSRSTCTPARTTAARSSPGSSRARA